MMVFVPVDRGRLLNAPVVVHLNHAYVVVDISSLVCISSINRRFGRLVSTMASLCNRRLFPSHLRTELPKES